MNERIEKLAEQAWVYQVRVLNEPNGSRTYTEKEKVFDKEKFAELIVGKCLDIIDEEGSHEGGSIRSMEKIKEHFGVKNDAN
jgi:VIT1/CCC1 family predicted Fe2+/Mn2+ transporter